MSEHTPAVKPWEWQDVEPIWQAWALIYHNVRVGVEKGPDKS